MQQVTSFTIYAHAVVEAPRSARPVDRQSQSTVNGRHEPPKPENSMRSSAVHLIFSGSRGFRFSEFSRLAVDHANGGKAPPSSHFPPPPPHLHPNAAADAAAAAAGEAASPENRGTILGYRHAAFWPFIRAAND